ncbi:hypothetical protein V4F55_000039 [Vibrio parahaemolyticus]|uniref:hypothetical protein n=1 Tax=Vibrio TaxID=662 RepID=UPI00280FE0B8|nr:hypothetical protein [Vibrio parahaemolyticus]EIV8506739.1 hypothetical protein [Vibrio parahaemolyticus]ELA9872587.1 hypothetical protein [Vibrio parahaemolyticus]
MTEKQVEYLKQLFEQIGCTARITEQGLELVHSWWTGVISTVDKTIQIEHTSINYSDSWTVDDIFHAVNVRSRLIVEEILKLLDLTL